MALGKKCKGCLKAKRAAGVVAEEAAELGFVKYTRGLGRKRIGISNNGEASPIDSYPNTPLKKQRSGKLIWDSERSALEALPQEILIKIVSGVDHDDLKQLFHVSKAVREATLIAKQCHFAYSTPSKTTRAFRNSIDVSDSDCNLDTPNAPKHKRPLPLPSRKKLADISVNLFASWEE